MTTITFWESNYKHGGNSGSGSYGILCDFKTDVLNTFITANNITSILDLGCGDGNQIKKILTYKYVGLDIIPSAVEKCKLMFKNDTTKTFECSQAYSFSDIFDMTISLDVIYHIVEDENYYQYILNLFKCSKRWVIIYSSNYNGSKVQHMHPRKFTDDLEKLVPDFKLVKKIPQVYPDISSADFYIYERI
jgi:cyclopropane fatty-acyl-phospholipid synthase-like methyltransferase